MNATERRALAKIIDQRFEILHNEIDQREEEIGEVIRKRIVADATRVEKEAQDRWAPIVKRAEALREEALDMLEAIRDDLGMAPGTVKVERQTRFVDEDVPLRRGQRPKTMELQRAHQYSSEGLTVHAGNKFAPAKQVEAQVKEELRKLGIDARKGRRSLEKRRLGLQEDLLLSAIESTDAKAFLEKIPTIEQLMPMPALEVSNG